SLALIGLEAGTTCVTPATQEDFSGAKSYNVNLARQVAMGSQLRLRFEQEARLLKKAMAKIAKLDQRIQAREEYIKKLEQETNSLTTVDTEVQGLRNQAMNLETLLEAEAQVTGEERIKSAFEEFKKYEDEWVNSRCAEMDARLDKLSVDFDEELYPHMLTAIVGHRWVIGHGLRLAVMKCAESSKIRRAFADVGSAGLAKDIEGYDPEANNKLIKALQDLKDLKYPIVDQLEKLRDAPMELIMASLHLKSDIREDTPQWTRDLCPSTSQLKIPVYPEVRNPRDPWAIKEEILLEDAIAANVSHAEKKKKCRVVCRTYGVGSAHHARSDDVLVSAPTVSPQGLAILLADASTLFEISEGEASPRLLRSMSLPAMYNLDWP
ncbi:hypothetical protein Tco_0246573, partial [Tanacetum coccineum]